MAGDGNRPSKNRAKTENGNSTVNRTKTKTAETKFRLHVSFLGGYGGSNKFEIIILLFQTKTGEIRIHLSPLEGHVTIT